ncbi:MAG: hypothetical protein AAF915_01965 [Cyanobacteria bacterium P01_D01_bin.50]
MTQIASKNDKSWTEKHLKFSIKYNLKGVCQTLWEWLISLSKKSKEIEFNLRDFQKYVQGLAGKPNTLKWVKKMFNKLVFLRIVSIDKDFGHGSYRINLRSPEAVTPKIRKEIKFHFVQVNSNLDASNDCHTEAGYNSSSSPNSSSFQTTCTDENSSSNINNQPETTNQLDIKEHHRKLQIIKACAKYGILFNPKKTTTNEIYKYPIEDINASLKLFKQRNKEGLIDNPQGWLIDCLRYGYWEDSLYTEKSFIADIEEIFTSVFGNSG